MTTLERNLIPRDMCIMLKNKIVIPGAEARNMLSEPLVGFLTPFDVPPEPLRNLEPVPVIVNYKNSI